MKAVKGYCKHVSMNCPAPTPTPTRSPTQSPTSAPTQTPTYGESKLTNCQKGVKHGGDKEGFYVYGSGSTNGHGGNMNGWIGCNINNAATTAGVEYTLYSRWNPHTVRNDLSKRIRNDPERPLGSSAMWGFTQAKVAKSSNKHDGPPTIDYAMYCSQPNAYLVIYEDGRRTGYQGNSHGHGPLAYGNCQCGSSNGQTETWITIRKNGQVDYYMASNHHLKKKCTSSSGAIDFPYVVDVSMYGAQAMVSHMTMGKPPTVICDYAGTFKLFHRLEVRCSQLQGGMPLLQVCHLVSG